MLYQDERDLQMALEHNSHATHALIVFVILAGAFAMYLFAENYRIYKAKNSNK